MNFIALESKQKLRGGYYTPNDLAAFLTLLGCAHQGLTRLGAQLRRRRILPHTGGD